MRFMDVSPGGTMNSNTVEEGEFKTVWYLEVNV